MSFSLLLSGSFYSSDWSSILIYSCSSGAEGWFGVKEVSERLMLEGWEISKLDRSQDCCMSRTRAVKASEAENWRM